MRAERFTLAQLKMLIAILEAGESTERHLAAAGLTWDGKVRWRPRLFFPGQRDDTMSRRLRGLERKKYVERFQQGGATKQHGRSWVSYTRFVRLTPEGKRVATLAKYGKIAPVDSTRGGR